MLDDDTAVRVQMKDPQIEFSIDLRPEGTFAFLNRLPGPGGLPVKTLGRGLCLLSGGIDSPVAAWSAMKRGLKVSFVSFHSPPYIGEGSREKIRDLIRVLAGWQGPSRWHEVQFAEIQLAIRKGAPESLRTILYRRSMQRIASHLARRSKIGALITGENLGQVASQTLENLHTIDSVATMPILRPLVGMHKAEIIKDARAMGSFDTSIEPHDDCCSFLMPPKPATRSTPEQLEAAEKSLDTEKEVLELVEAASVETIRGRLD
jgi:thiamine biosynthesis protein ThiI